MHQLGVVHRDVKPPNILVARDGEGLKAELVDFGLSRGSGFDDTERHDPTAAVRYLSPEAAGLISATVDQRADLYALGVVLFECLTGTPPFDGDTVGEVLRRHLNTEPPQLRSLGIAAPRALEGVLQRLMAKDPEARYQSAAAALLDIEEIRVALQAGLVEPLVTPGQRDLRHVLAEPAFVARAEELAELVGTLDRPAGPARRLVLVEAESGAGKTRLLDELTLHATQRDVLVLRGQGVDQAAPRPFQMLEGIAQGIVASFLDTELAAGGGLRGHLGDRADAAVGALPALAAVVGPADLTSLGPEQYGETRSIDALLRLLEVLGDAPRDVLIILDDCQWADAMTLKLLDRWQDRRTGDEEGRLVVVAAFRSEEVTAGHPLRSVDPTSVVALRPFTAADVEALCESMAGPLPPEAVTSVVRLADGSPFMASAVLRGMVETGALRAGRDGWEIDPGPMADVQTSRRAALILQRRFELLAPDTIGFLSIGAVLGKEFDLSLAMALSGHDARRVAPALDSARRRRILWVTESEGRCAFTHDKLRETLLDGLDPAERRRLHLAAAERIEAMDPDRAFELAYHFDAAGESARAMPYALRAARQARARHALDVAVTHYQIAERAGAGQDEVSARVAEELGDVLMLQGDYPGATRHLQRALELSEDAVARAVLNGKLGDVAFKQGDQVSAARSLEGALRALGRWVPRSRLTTFVAVLFEAFVQALHTLLPRVFVARRSAEGAEREFVAIRLYSNLAHVYWFSAGKFSCAWTHLREMNLAERYPASPELAQAYSEHAPVMTDGALVLAGPGLRRALTGHPTRKRRRLGAGTVAQLRRHGALRLLALPRVHRDLPRIDPPARANWRALGAEHGRLAPGLRPLPPRRARFGARSGARPLLHRDLHRRRHGGRHRAEWLGPRRRGACPRGLRGHGDRTGPRGRPHLDRGPSGRRGAPALRRRDRGRRAALHGGARRSSSEAGLHAEYFAPVRPWLATALRMQAELVDPVAAARRAPSGSAAPAHAARRAHRLARSYRNNLPHALRERAAVAGLRGQKARASRWFAASLRASEAQDAAYETAFTREAMARLAANRGRFLARTALSEVELERMRLEPQERQEPLITYSLADRFEQLLDVGRRIGAAVSPSDVYQELHQAALLMLRGDHCNVVRIGDAIDDPLVSDSGSMVPDISRSLMRQAIEQMAPVVSGAPGDTDDDGHHAAGRPAVHLVRAHRLGGSGRRVLQRHPSPGR